MAADQISIQEPAGTAARKPMRRSAKKIAVVACGTIAALACVGGGAALFLARHPLTASDASEHRRSAAIDAGAEFIDVPPMVVNLRSPDGGAHFLKLHFMLVPGDGIKADEIKAALPLIHDGLQPFLRELRPEDLAGSAAIFRIKEEMLVRAGAVIGRGKVKDVLIQDLIQQ